jgi:predicted transcriptional regulator
MRLLESKKLVIKEFQDYSLSQTGEIVTLNLITMINSIYLAKKNKNFLLNHEIDSIPEVLINKIENLCNFKVLRCESAISMLKESLNSSKNVNCIFGNSNYKKILFEILKDKKDNLNLILKDTYLNEIIQTNHEIQLKNRNIMLWEFNNDLKLNLIVLDNLMFLNLPHVNENPIFYLVIKNTEGINWGTELFNYYLNQSEEFNID